MTRAFMLRRLAKLCYIVEFDVLTGRVFLYFRPFLKDERYLVGVFSSLTKAYSYAKEHPNPNILSNDDLPF